MNHNKEAKSLTFWRGSEVSQDETTHRGSKKVGHRLLGAVAATATCAAAPWRSIGLSVLVFGIECRG